MKSDPEHDRLLDEVLAEQAPAEFRAQMLDGTLKQVRHRRRLRRWNRGALVVAGIVIFSFLWLRDHAPLKRQHESLPETALQMINSQPLNPSMLVESIPGSVPVVVPVVSTLSMITTDPANHTFRELTDEELLSLVPGQPAMLVRQGPHQAELLIVNAGAGVISPGENR